MLDVMRIKSGELSASQKSAIEFIKDFGNQFHHHIDTFKELKEFKGGREIALAKTKLEECVMWAVKGVSGEQ